MLRFQQLKVLGLIPETHQLPTLPKFVLSWADLSREEQKSARDMKTYAAMIDYLDEQIGRVIQWLETIVRLGSDYFQILIH